MFKKIVCILYSEEPNVFAKRAWSANVEDGNGYDNVRAELKKGSFT